ncbi:hypothetical protein GCM10010287_04020 [Streptomyces variabilis]|uniref:Uncharacterized protein n=1 Tax=Streptomyces variabilis TaxID=67372 RepID=A0ABQ2TQJ3_9ACTN|nr:hypothetical protein GCM10010265_37560 [Streptomyces griseoincarnatus]GGT34740.1 hypothetical protein GCM10010287_04020 [Streptomyces variabilis]
MRQRICLRVPLKPQLAGTDFDPAGAQRFGKCWGRAQRKAAPLISLEQAAGFAQKFVDEDPLNSQVDLIPFEGEVAVVGGAAYFSATRTGATELDWVMSVPSA